MRDNLPKMLRAAAKEWREENKVVATGATHYDSALEEAADAIEELSKPRWIPVTERLPEMHDEVLICNDDYGKTGLGFATVAVWDGSDWVNAWDREGTICCVTHWIPLPTPPKEKRSMKAKYGINPISGGEKMNCANDPVTVLPESALPSATIKCGGAVTCTVASEEVYRGK